ncbi:MAG: 3-phosphoshikimate 1-carboxyvinyltransferase, partial [Phycisphaerae bacterium]|nr:3-phosphoshikimate 1-carboxyvinyltransferase [Phycisphaerae bacterium]
ARRTMRVHGCRGNLPNADVEINVGEAGTAMRFMTALVCLGQGHYRLDGAPRMRERPIAELVGALTDIGAAIGYDGVTGYPPLSIMARGLAGGEIEFRTPPSSQFVTAILMVAPYAARDVMIRIEGTVTSRPYIQMTLDVMRGLGVETLEAESSRFIIPASQRYRSRSIDIEPDASGATYLWAAAAITGGHVRVEGLTRASHQGDARFVDVLERMGCTVREDASSLEVTGPQPGQLRAVDEDLNAMPDTVQTLAVAALFANGQTNISNVANLRIKETDRLKALATELCKFGARVEVRDDGISIIPPPRPSSANVDTYNDHRMAMAFAVAGLRAPRVLIRNAGCVSKSFPEYFDVLRSLTPEP